MIKSNLPVILLKGLVLLPLGDARIELNNEISKKIIDISKLYHDNEILIVTPINDLEESPDTSDLPRIGVIAKIVSRIDLPNGNTRIVLRGEKRVKVLSYVNYSNEKDVLESIVVSNKEEEYNLVEETALLRKLIGELDKFISVNPYISNSILNQIKGIDDLEKLTDIIANFLPLNFEKKLSLMLDASRTSRAKKLITEINVELAVLELENKIELELKKDLDDLQKEMILKEKLKVIKAELGEKDTKTEYIESVKSKLDENEVPTHIRKRIETELKRYEITVESSPELAVIRNYIDYLLSIPWSTRTIDEESLSAIEERLNKTHYGLTEVKTRILEYIAIKNNNSQVVSPIICLIGPPGVGKTTLAESIAASLNKKFAKISLGGINDPAELVGHRKTYIGSAPGKIISSVIKAKSKNPVILLDEIDKMSKDYKGDPVSSLLDLLDNNQNKEFIDNYIEEPVDLSEVTWIITANDKSLIPYVLLDRLELIEINSYLNFEKIKITEDYLIESAKRKNGLTDVNITFTRDAILKIINEYTKESGVRELERLINKIIRKIIVEKKLNGENIKDTILDVKDIRKYLNVEKYPLESLKSKNQIGYSKGLAYTPSGGEILGIEVTSYPGKEAFITSGHLGNVIKESTSVALSYIKANLDKFKINPKDLEKTIHINFREGGIPKDGPSAGAIITSTIISHLTKKEIPSNVSITGEITLLGEILPVGGLREKAAAALRNGINKIYVSKNNKRDIMLLEKEIKEKITFIFVSDYMEIYNDLFERRDNNDRKKSYKTTKKNI